MGPRQRRPPPGRPLGLSRARPRLGPGRGAGVPHRQAAPGGAARANRVARRPRVRRCHRRHRRRPAHVVQRAAERAPPGLLCRPLRPDLVDDGVEHLLAHAEALPHEHAHDLALLVLPALVAETDRRRLAVVAQLVGDDRGVEVEGVHGRVHHNQARRARTRRLRPGRLRYCRPMRRQPRAVYWVVFVDALLMFAIVPLLPGYVRDLHLTKTEVGLVVGIYSGAVLVGSVPVGYLAWRVGARGLTIFGVALLAVATFGCAFAGGFLWLLAARTGQGLSSAVSWTAGMAWLSEASEPNVRGRVLGTAMSFATVGAPGGPVIGGAVGGAYGLRAPFVLLGIATVVLTLVVARAP